MIKRRDILAGLITSFASSAMAQSVYLDPNNSNNIIISGNRNNEQRNISSFKNHSWEEYFENTNNGVILVDINSRVLNFWSEDRKIYKIYPCSVPMSEELTKRGKTKIIKKVKDPTWRPTPSMKERNPDWPDEIGPGPENPLGTHALYLSWQYFRIHGTHEDGKIGRRSSNGCIGLYNHHINELYNLVKINTQVIFI